MTAPTRREPPAGALGSAAVRGRCAACGAPVDVLRAPAVRMTSSGVLVYCSVLHRELPTRSEPAASDVGATPPGAAAPVVAPPVAIAPPAAIAPMANAPLETAGEPVVQEVPAAALEAAVTAPPDSAGPRRAAAGVQSVVGSRRTTRASLLVWAAVVAVLLVAFAVEWSRGGAGISVLVLLGVVLLWAILSQQLATLSSKLRDAERLALGARLGTEARRVREQETAWVSVRSLRPGEGVIVEGGEFVPCDGVVLAGDGRVVPFPEAQAELVATQGLRLSAGARLVSGSLHVVCTAAGGDRAFDALHSGLRSREASLSRLSRAVRHRVAPAVGVASLLLGVWLAGSWLIGILVGAANFAALVSPLPYRLVTLLQDTWLLILARQGVDFGPEGFDAASHAQVAVFCARGTFLAGEPEVTDIVALGDAKEAEVLALAAGAESVATHPAAASIRRAAHDRHVAPEATRGHDVLGGMGVTCYASDGHRVLVGTRELMMKERISIAASEEELRKMEQRGRSGILVARGGRLVGLLALHDALRRGARAAVQLLLDVHIEPVLLSGEARNATEALGRALSIEHVRPEVPARERAAEVRRMIEGGAAVAVIGHSPLDDSALSAASVPIVLDGSALTPRPRSVTLLGDEVLTAAHALVAAQTARRDALVALVLCLAPAGLGVLCSGSLLFPPVVAPLGALLGGVAAALWAWSCLERAQRFMQKLPKGIHD